MKKKIILSLLLLVSVIGGYKWYRKTKQKYVEVETKPLCSDPNNCLACEYYKECYGPDADI